MNNLAISFLYNLPQRGPYSYGCMLDAQLRRDCKSSLRWGTGEAAWAARLIQEAPHDIEGIANSIKFRRLSGEFDNGFKFS